MMRSLAAILALALLSGCAAVMETKVVRSHGDAPALREGGTYSFVSKDGSKQTRGYAHLAAMELAKHNWREVSAANAQYRIRFVYSMTARKTEPEISVVTMTIANGAALPIANEYLLRDECTRYLAFIILDKRTNRKIYEVHVSNAGASNDMSHVIGVMVRAAFEDFPGRNGTQIYRSLVPEWDAPL